MRYHYTLKMMTTSKADKVKEKLDPSYFAGGNVIQYSYSGKQFWQFLIKLTM